MSISILIMSAFAGVGVLAGLVKALIYILPNKEGRDWLRNGEYIVRHYIFVHVFYGGAIGAIFGMLAAYLKSR